MKSILNMLVVTLIVLSSATFAHAANLSGSVAFTGKLPPSATINMDADPSCSALHTEPVMNETIVANSNGTLKNAFVYIKTGLEGKDFEAPKEKKQLDQNGCRYSPRVLGLQVNQDLEILNSDATLHNVHGMPENSKEFNLGMPIKGMKLKRKFKDAEVMVKFKCDVHPWMSAYVGVLPHSFYDVTNDEGSFTIGDVPAGTYTVEVWHETLGTQSQEVTVAESDQALNFSFAG